MRLTLWLIGINFLVFSLQQISGEITLLFGLIPIRALSMPWQFLTYMFLHANLTHIFFNMFTLFLFGPRIEYTLGKKRFLAFYLACGVGSAIFYLVLNLSSPHLLIGASGAVVGVLTAFGLLYPTEIIFIYGLPMPALVAVVLFASLEFLLGLSAPQSPVAHLGHAGGALTAFCLIKGFGLKKKPYHL